MVNFTLTYVNGVRINESATTWSCLFGRVCDLQLATTPPYEGPPGGFVFKALTFLQRYSILTNSQVINFTNKYTDNQQMGILISQNVHQHPPRERVEL